MTIKLQEKLCAEKIDAAAEAVIAFLDSKGEKKDDVIRCRLLVEETLLHWLENGISDSFVLRMGTRFHKPFVSVEAIGERCNVLEQQGTVLLRNLLQSAGKEPSYSYRNGCNAVMMRFPGKQASGLIRFLTAVAAAVAVGLACVLLLPEGFCSVLLTDFVDPLYAFGFRILGLVAGPLILFTVIWGINGIGDAAALGNIGKNFVVRYLTILFILPFTCLIYTPFLGLQLQSGGEGVSAVKDIFEMLLGIVPSNIVEPFLSGNTLQIIFLAVVMGIAILFLGKQASVLAEVTEQLNNLVQFLMGLVGSMMPGLIFIIIFRLILNHTVSSLGVLWKPLLLVLGECFLLCAVFAAVTSIRFKIPAAVLIRKILPCFVIAAATASSTAAFPKMLEICEKELGVEKSCCGFGIPLGMVLFKTGDTVVLMLMALFFAGHCGVPISVVWIIKAGLLSTLLSIATPPVAGANIVVFTMLFAKLGIPEDALALLFSVIILFDFVGTSANVFSLPLESTFAAAAGDGLDVEVLRKR